MELLKCLVVAIVFAITVAAENEAQMHRRLVAVRLRGGAAARSGSASVAALDEMPMPR